MSAISLTARTWTALVAGMETIDPACQADDRFILDDQPAHTLKYICDECPLNRLCADYAQANRPSGGIWAGKRYSVRTNRSTDRSGETK